MIRAWRIAKQKHAARAFDGEGARLFGGRWNLKGALAVYAADSLALAALEQFIHLGRAGLHMDFVYFEIAIPKGVDIAEPDPADLPKDWRRHPPPESTMKMGSDWLQSGKGAVLRVPSALIPQGFNFLFNPIHPDFARLQISEPARFTFDPRMWK